MARLKVRVNVASHLGCDPAIKEFFRAVLADYCRRFKVKVQPGNWIVDIVIAEYEGPGGSTGMTSSLDHKVIVQVRDPYMGTNYPNNEVLNYAFAVVLAHEFVHVCQALTGREGISLKLGMDEEDCPEHAEYHFDSAEIEARILAEFYTHLVPEILYAKLRECAADEE